MKVLNRIRDAAPTESNPAIVAADMLDEIQKDTKEGKVVADAERKKAILSSFIGENANAKNSSKKKKKKSKKKRQKQNKV